MACRALATENERAISRRGGSACSPPLRATCRRRALIRLKRSKPSGRRPGHGADTTIRNSDREATMVQASPIDTDKKARIDAILTGAIDPHVHSGPSIAARALDHLDLVRQLSDAGFAAVVTKDHDYVGVATAA